VAYVLHNKADVGVALKTSYPAPTKLVNGDLSPWVGQNPKGTWRLIVADWAAGGSAGKLLGWSVNLKVLSTKKVGVNGNLQVGGSKTSCILEPVTGGAGFRVVCSDGAVFPGFAATNDVQVGSTHACAQRRGRAYCWGDNADGSLVEQASVFVSISVGYGYNCGLLSNGALKCWGNNGAPAPLDAGFASVSVGSGHACGLRKDGSVICWGSNSYGQAQAPIGQYKFVSAGIGASCGIKIDGTLACWGSWKGGTNSTPSGTFVAVDVSEEFACALRSDQTLACWGPGNCTTTTPLSSPPSGKFKSVSTGYCHSCGLRADGTIVCWGGTNNNGELNSPQGTFLSVSAGNSVSCGLTEDGGVVCWGNSSNPAGFVPAAFK
jgi:alpha-tubulin suppressor-like RCC1 family protein